MNQWDSVSIQQSPCPPTISISIQQWFQQHSAASLPVKRRELLKMKSFNLIISFFLLVSSTHANEEVLSLYLSCFLFQITQLGHYNIAS